MNRSFKVTLVGATNDLLSNLHPGWDARPREGVKQWELRSLGTSTDFTPVFNEASGHDSTTVDGTTVRASLTGVDDWNINSVGAGFVEILIVD